VKDEICLRLATRADAAAIAAVLREAFGEFQPLYTPEAFPRTVIGAEEVEQRIQEGPVWVSMVAGEIAGTASAVAQGQIFYIRGMAVVPSARGKGIARRLLEEIDKAARQNSCNRLRLSTTPFLESAIRLYERFGFTREPEGIRDWYGTPLLFMEKAIG